MGVRVKPKRHEIRGWNKFRYEIIKPEYRHLMRRIEYHTIRSFAKLLENKGKARTLDISEYVLKNKNWEKP